MEDINHRIEQLEIRFRQLQVEQEKSLGELNATLKELQALKSSMHVDFKKSSISDRRPIPSQPSFQPSTKSTSQRFSKDQLENIIGSNLINKI